MHRLSRSNLGQPANRSPQPVTRPTQPDTILTVLNSFQKAKE